MTDKTFKEEKNGSICASCKSKDIVYHMGKNKLYCRSCGSFEIKDVIIKWISEERVRQVWKSIKPNLVLKGLDYEIEYFEKELNLGEE